MSIDSRLREGLLLTSTELPDPDPVRALDTVLSRSRATSRRRWLAAAGAAAVVAATIAALVVVPHLIDDEGAPSPARPPSPPPGLDAATARVIAEGDLVSYGADASGTVLTVWTTCAHVEQSGCASVWRLGAGTEPRAAGPVLPPRTTPPVVAGGGGFVLQPYNQAEGTYVAADGTTTRLRRGCAKDAWPSPVQPGRYVVSTGLLGPYLVDTVAGTSCDTTGFEARTLRDGAYAEDGTLWGLVGDGNAGPWPAVGRYDGVRWSYHDLVGTRSDGDNALAVAGSHVAVLHGADGAAVHGLSVTSDGGASWSEVGAADLPFHAYDSMAFAGTSTLFVADSEGVLWRSTDGTRFSRVETSDRVSGLESAGDAVIARVGSTDGDALVRITGDGSTEPLVVR